MLTACATRQSHPISFFSRLNVGTPALIIARTDVNVDAQIHAEAPQLPMRMRISASSLIPTYPVIIRRERGMMRWKTGAHSPTSRRQPAVFHPAVLCDLCGSELVEGIV
ncbi:hypothetical protein EVAR_82501_1 [Eumeta japonica]|uniref:Uncharacterized protein n=1 Tax=Eumeta variegata TaxID=151549 RepID=A0A4C1UWV5_EUMVA|nr:hypothetical protein EVAR_82501_1 [Eumeta japonica]